MKHLLRLAPYLKPFRLRIIFSLTILLILTGISLVIPVIIQNVVDIGISQNQVNFLVTSSLVLLALGVIRAGLNYILRYTNEWVSSNFGFDLRNRLFNHIQNLPFSYHDHTQSGQLISRCIEDVRAIERFAGFGVTELIHIIIMMVVITIILFVEEPILAIISILPLIPLVWITMDFGRKVGSFFYEVDHTMGDLSSNLQENVTGVQVVRAFAREEYEIKKFRTINELLYNARVSVVFQWSRIMPTTNFLVALSTVLIVLFGGILVIRGEMTVGQVVAFNAYLLMLAGPTRQLAWLVNSAGEADAGAQRTMEVLDIKPSIRSPDNPVDISEMKGKVEFKDVCFQYETGKNVAVEEINFRINPNQIVALIGSTGSGKSTIVNLIPRFYDSSTGSVLIDDVNVKDVDLVDLRQQIGIVLQSSLLFSTTIKENIAYGRPDASMEEIISAAKSAQADEFINELPDGYDTIVGERGITLSGGQRQRVAIARAILLDPKILILDDSTSSVDTETEKLIQDALDCLMEGRTSFIIAHRLATVRRADIILVLDKGRIVEKGTHSELIQQDGVYREIYDLQLRDQERIQEDLLTMNQFPELSGKTKG